MPRTLSRRSMLKFFGASAAGVLAEPLASDLVFGAGAKAFAHGNRLSFTPVRLPTPLPIYARHGSFLATCLGRGSVLPASGTTKLEAYTVIDDVVVPPEYKRYVIVHWGERVFPNSNDYVGYNADYTGFVPTSRADRHDDDDDELHSHQRGRKNPGRHDERLAELHGRAGGSAPRRHAVAYLPTTGGVGASGTTGRSENVRRSETPVRRRMRI